MYMTDSDIRRFKMFMVGAGYNITTLAKALEMTRESLSSRIKGKIDFEREEMMKIAELFNTNPAKIFFENKVA